MSEPLPTTTDARRMGTHSGDGTDGFHLLEVDGGFHIVASFPNTEKLPELQALLDFIIAVHARLSPSYASKGPYESNCSLALELKHGNRSIRIEQPVRICDTVKVRPPFSEQMRSLFQPKPSYTGT